MSHTPSVTALSRIAGFDPRRLPFERDDAQLPAVQQSALRVDALRQRFAQSRPWQPEITLEHRWIERQADPRQAAVLVPIVAHDAPTVLLTQRSAQLKSHSGQIAFPGGKVDDSDPSVEAAALREAQEEVGLAPEQVTVLGALPTYTTGTGFVITPVVGLVQPDSPLRLNAGEVDDAFEVPLAFLMNPAHHLRQHVDWEGARRGWLSMPYRDEQGRERFIWGATAGMLRNLYRFLAA